MKHAGINKPCAFRTRKYFAIIWLKTEPNGIFSTMLLTYNKQIHSIPLAACLDWSVQRKKKKKNFQEFINIRNPIQTDEVTVHKEVWITQKISDQKYITRRRKERKKPHIFSFSSPHPHHRKITLPLQLGTIIPFPSSVIGRQMKIQRSLPLLIELPTQTFKHKHKVPISQKTRNERKDQDSLTHLEDKDDRTAKL